VQTQITTVGQTSEGLGSSQATAYKAEIDVKWLTKTSVPMVPQYMQQNKA
jgi:HAE1 family hydrophobic/amphiphilic exporter-1